MWTATGLVPVDPLLATLDVALIVDSVTPADISDAGGDLVTFSGSGFPSSIESLDFKEIIFTDGTVCVVVSCNSNELVCETEEFEDLYVDDPNDPDGRRMLQATETVCDLNVNGLHFVAPLNLVEI